MSKATVFIAFTIGAAAGAATAWYFTKTKYEQIAQEEIDSVKETFSKLYKREDEVGEPDKNVEESTDEASDEPLSVMDYARKIRQEGYLTRDDAESSEPPEALYSLPYVIAPESFDELEGYEALSFTYYSDKVLADDRDRAVDDLETAVGFSSYDELEGHFGEHEDDSIFVRDDRLKHDIEILFDSRKYSDVLAKEPYKAEV